MTRSLSVIVLLLLATASAVAEEITTDMIISARSFGAPTESIIRKIQDPANTIAEMSADDFVKLRSAGVSEAIIQALVTRASSARPSGERAVQPDNPEIAEVVRLVESGLSESLIIEQVRRAAPGYELTNNDLIYLKQNQVPESIIAALIGSVAQGSSSAPSAASTTSSRHAARAATPRPEDDNEFEGLVLNRPSFLKKNRTGTAVLTEDRLLWRDSANAKENLEIFPAGLKRIRLKCEARAEGESFCFEVELGMTKGDDFTFTDAKRDMGGNETLMRFCNALRKAFPNVPYKEKLD
jgi:hypothetical protein